MLKCCCCVLNKLLKSLETNKKGKDLTFTTKIEVFITVPNTEVILYQIMDIFFNIISP